MRPNRSPELIILYDAEDTPNGALCSACAQQMPAVPPGIFSSRDIEAYVTGFRRHLELAHPELGREESPATQ